ncbi:MAG TPA: TrkA family potassium uptake protein [Saprospiraceae bacterium]|jgi:trk system potassium uptake protein TrkA|nr:TrkA family potassium uptake protein [Saprospiraceae bacterium]HMP13505.1 TrkA family potassium uptake protein [Saprospiraceae bacterium]
MKVIVFGLGNFGKALAIQMSEMGHEVIGVDKSIAKAEMLKDQLSHTICFDSTNPAAIQQLPIRDTDLAIVAIGEDEGASILTTAVLKTSGFKRIISRALSPTHESVLEAMGIDEIAHPEQDSAERLAKKLNLKIAIESFEIDRNYSIVEIKTPLEFVNRSILEVDPRRNHNINIVTILRKMSRKNLLGIRTTEWTSIGVVKPEEVFLEDDILVVFGENVCITKICNNGNKVPF